MRPKVTYDPVLREKPLSALEIGAVLGVSRNTVLNWSSRGLAGLRLRYTLIGARRRYTLSDYEVWQEAVERELHPPKSELLRTRKARHRAAVKQLRAQGMKI